MLKRIEISGFKSFAKKTALSFDTPVTAIVGPNGSGKSNVVEAVRFVLGEQSMKSLRGKGGSDLIWKGSKLLGALSKARVAITFDNSGRQFAFSSSSGAIADLAFDEITLSREVSSDGGSAYFINGTSVRLKDIQELLGSVNIGTSGHHIISQGEADRLLSASARDRRAMVEDALGLKVYQMRIRDSERKLEKTAQNMKEVQALRRELAPHLSFLSKQVEKIQKGEELRKEFDTLFSEYASTESASVAFLDTALRVEEEALRTELVSLPSAPVQEARSAHEGERAQIYESIRTAEEKQHGLLRQREDLGRAIGRIEGKLDALSVVQETTGTPDISREATQNLCDEIMAAITEAQGMNDVLGIQSVLSSMLKKVQAFTQSMSGAPVDTNKESVKQAIEQERAGLEAKVSEIDAMLSSIRAEIARLRERLVFIEKQEREAERSSYEGAARRATLEGSLRECALRRAALDTRKAVLAEEIKEAEPLLGHIIHVVQNPQHQADTAEQIAEREALHRKLERIKIKLEDIGGASGGEILKEYEETKDRDAFLVRELADIEQSMAALRELIHELRDTIERTFKEGIEKINLQFGEFFKQMFNGGSAFLSVVVEHKRSRDEELDTSGDDDALPFEHGVEINVSLPHKKVKDLNMLSGGERSLVSIALLFAMSQVNPPPFLVLDETDAALDEANSRRYGDMIDTLSKHSHLIVVTHNRETMSRAQVLYGVTMGLEGASKLLSIKFDEAVKIAK